jgi:hypothetical protein
VVWAPKAASAPSEPVCISRRTFEFSSASLR